MAPRATDAAVRAIIQVAVDITDITPFIDFAHELVEEHCLNSEYTETRLTMIEVWLSAHVYTVRDPRTTSEGVSGLSESYQGVVGMNLASSIYGQQVMMLDSAGNLAALSKRSELGQKANVVGLAWLGTASET